jgi:hypothetical protein
MERNIFCGLTDIHDPSIAYRPNEATALETLDEESKSKAPPSTDEVSSDLPKKDRDRASNCTCDDTRKQEQTTKCCAWRMNGLNDTVLKNKDKADDGKGIKADQKERGPVTEYDNQLINQVRLNIYHLFLCPQKALERPLKISRTPRTPNAGSIFVLRVYKGAAEDVAEGADVEVADKEILYVVGTTEV